MITPELYGTLDGFYEYYKYAIDHMKERYTQLTWTTPVGPLDAWIIEADIITEHLLNEAIQYGLSVNQALSPIAFMDDWIRYGFPNVGRYPGDYEEVWLPAHLFTLTTVDDSHITQQTMRLMLRDYVLSINLEQETAYSNDWYVSLIRKRPTPQNPVQQPPVHHITNELIMGNLQTTELIFNLDQYMDKYMDTFDALRKPYNDPMGIRTQLYVRACRIKGMAKQIQVSGDLLMRYKNAQIGYQEHGIGFIPTETQKAIFAMTLFRLPVITSTFVIV